MNGKKVNRSLVCEIAHAIRQTGAYHKLYQVTVETGKLLIGGEPQETPGQAWEKRKKIWIKNLSTGLENAKKVLRPENKDGEIK